jgi:hypothetical protein
MQRFALVVLTACTTTPPSLPSIDGAAAWSQLARSLPGTWRLVPTVGSTRSPFVVRYRLISNASALVEEWGFGGSRETETVFYPDHADVMLTHFCAQGNQPRLRAIERTADTVRFRFVDVTNRAADQDMLVDRTLHVLPGTLEITEVYRTTSGADDITRYRFDRQN